MARQDYVSHSPKPKKKPYVRKKVAPRAPLLSLKAKLITFFTISAIAGFAYLLWTIKDSKPPVKVKAVKEKKEVVLPALPTEKWEYINDLSDKGVVGSEYEVEQGGPYKLQCGSFKTLKQAEVLKANIAFSGLTAQIKSGNTWHKVFLGPYKKKRKAENDKNKLKRNRVSKCVIWNWE